MLAASYLPAVGRNGDQRAIPLVFGRNLDYLSGMLANCDTTSNGDCHDTGYKTPIDYDRYTDADTSFAYNHCVATAIHSDGCPHNTAGAGSCCG